MTLEGLRDLRSALKQVATRQTAVACYQNDGRRRMKLIWIVGARHRFGPNGHYPSATTTKKIGNQNYPLPAWARLGCNLVEAAGLMHDIGKASERFQSKLRTPIAQRDDVRHEWLSLKLLQKLRFNNGDWTAAWQHVTEQLEAVTLGDRSINNRSTTGVANVREAIDFLIVSHHGLLASASNGGTLPTSEGRHVRQQPSRQQTSPAGNIDPKIFDDFWRIERKLESGSSPQDTVFWRALLIFARAALIFSDHVVSARKHPDTSVQHSLYANTTNERRIRRLNQTLDAHLRDVATTAKSTLYRMVQLNLSSEDSTELQGLSEESVEAIRRQAASDSRFNWQNRCAGALSKIRKSNSEAPALVFNMASTGSGKTRMNARAATVLSSSIRPRLSIALNLRSLTLQTGDALRRGLNLGEDEISTVIGNRTAQDLLNNSKKEVGASDIRDSDDDDENWIEDEIDCYGPNQVIPDWMAPLFRDTREQIVVGAPFLVSTIDFLVAAGEPNSQGHHVKALIRVMTSELILDEIDGYEPLSLVSVLRLVQLSAFFKRQVICSSATLSKPVVVAIERAYRSGVNMRVKLDTYSAPGESSCKSIRPEFIRAFIDDDLEPLIEVVPANQDDIEQAYTSRLEAVKNSLAQKPVYRLARLQPVENQDPESWLSTVCEAVQSLHETNRWSFDGERTISFGLVRVATIETAIEVARVLATNLPHSKVACYHANDFVISRFHKERTLDRLLSRAKGDDHIRRDTEIGELVGAASGPSVLFIVVATPVEEIGRDHDFDWAFIEPSSAQSLVQTAGRVNRHRVTPILDRPNVLIPQFNIRHCRNHVTGKTNQAAFVWPGYEARPNSRKRHRDYGDHDLVGLLPWHNDMLVINALLRFDTEQCRLARADDHSIDEILQRYFGSSGYFICDPVDGWLLSTGPYNATPLRASAAPRITWRLANEDGSPIFYRKERVVDKGRLVDRWFSSSMIIAPKKKNSWLDLSIDEMENLCVEMGIAPEDGMQVQLTTYTPEDQFEYDQGFGIMRLKR